VNPVPIEVAPAEQPATAETKSAKPSLAPFALPPYAWAPMYEAPEESESPEAAPVADGAPPSTESAGFPVLPGVSAALLALLAAAMVVLARRSQGPRGLSAP
jgi:hypothetical protein